MSSIPDTAEAVSEIGVALLTTLPTRSAVVDTTVSWGDFDSFAANTTALFTPRAPVVALSA